MSTMISIIVAAVLLGVMAIVFAGALKSAKSDKEDALRSLKESHEATLSGMKESHAAALSSVKASYETTLSNVKGSYERAIDELKKSHETALAQQLETVKAQVTAESEKMLKAREEELEKRARQTFEAITGGLDKEIKGMKEAFEQSRKTHTETSQSLKENLENAVRNLREQTVSIGDKADSLADALRGKNKTQGNWGEIILDNLFTNEGMREGRDYDKEVTLRDENGTVVRNEDTSKRMRPDFILHYPDGNDVVVDSKVVLTAADDYFKATTQEDKDDAMARNLAAIKEQVKNLSKKDYSRYLTPGRRMLDYVIMFVPNIGALWTALDAEPDLWRKAAENNVYIADEQSLYGALKIVSLTWTQVAQAQNHEKVFELANEMIDRVGMFMEKYEGIGKALKKASEEYEDGKKKLIPQGQIIINTSGKLIKLGAKNSDKHTIKALLDIDDIPGQMTITQ